MQASMIVGHSEAKAMATKQKASQEKNVFTDHETYVKHALNFTINECFVKNKTSRKPHNYCY